MYANDGKKGPNAEARRLFVCVNPPCPKLPMAAGVPHFTLLNGVVLSEWRDDTNSMSVQLPVLVHAKSKMLCHVDRKIVEAVVRVTGKRATVVIISQAWRAGEFQYRYGWESWQPRRFPGLVIGAQGRCVRG